MSIMEIVLLAAGGIIFTLSFLIPAKKEAGSEETRGLAKEEIKTLVSEELEAIRGHVDDVVEEAVTYSIEKTERSLERLSNEKIMAVNEYSDTVLAEIHKNHEEVMFLYDMLNDKHINLKNTVSEINRTVKEAKETKKEAEEVVNTFQRLAPEAVIPLRTNRMEIPSGPAAAKGADALHVSAHTSAVKQPSAAPQAFASAPAPMTASGNAAPQAFASAPAPMTASGNAASQAFASAPAPMTASKAASVQGAAASRQSAVGQTPKAPAMTPESAASVTAAMEQESVMTQKSAASAASAIAAEPVIASEYVIPAAYAAAPASVTEQEIVMARKAEISAMTAEPVMTPESAVSAEPVIEPAPAMEQESVMMPESAGSAIPVIEPEPVMTQVFQTAPPDTLQGAVVTQPSAAVPQVFASAPVSVTPQTPHQMSAIMPQTTAVMQQVHGAPQIFASAPIPAAPQPYTAQQILSGPAGGTGSPLPPDVISFTQETDEQGRNYNDRIMEMHKNGKSNVAIARELNLGVGEVKLVIDLYKNRSEK